MSKTNENQTVTEEKYCYDMEKVKSLNCMECIKFQIKQLPGGMAKCSCADRQDGKVGFQFTDYHECLQPQASEMEDAIWELKSLLDAGALNRNERAGAEAILNKINGASNDEVVKMVKEKGIAQGVAFVEKQLLKKLHDSKSTKALAQWVKIGTEERKSARTKNANDICLALKAKSLAVVDNFDRVVLDGKKYIVLYKDSTKARVLAESGDGHHIFDEEFNNFRSSNLNQWLNTEWLQDNPEAGKCIIGHVELLDEKEYQKYESSLPKLKSSWWLKTSFVNDTSVVKAVKPDGDVGISAVHFEGNYVRPAFWIDIMHLKFKNNKQMPLDSQLDTLGKRYAAAKNNTSLSDSEVAHLFTDIRQDLLKTKANSGLDEELFLYLMEEYGISKDFLFDTLEKVS